MMFHQDLQVVISIYTFWINKGYLGKKGIVGA